MLSPETRSPESGTRSRDRHDAGGAGQTKDAAARDLVLGTWILDVEASSYSPGPAPKSQRRIYEAAPEGIKTTITGIDANGREWSAEYVAMTAWNIPSAAPVRR